MVVPLRDIEKKTCKLTKSLIQCFGVLLSYSMWLNFSIINFPFLFYISLTTKHPLIDCLSNCWYFRWVLRIFAFKMTRIAFACSTLVIFNNESFIFWHLVETLTV